MSDPWEILWAQEARASRRARIMMRLRAIAAGITIGLAVIGADAIASHLLGV